MNEFYDIELMQKSKDEYGMSLLHLAILKDDWLAISSLLEQDIDFLGLVDNFGCNLLHYVALSASRQTVDTILEAIQNNNELLRAQEANYGATPAHLAARQ